MHYLGDPPRQSLLRNRQVHPVCDHGVDRDTSTGERSLDFHRFGPSAEEGCALFCSSAIRLGDMRFYEDVHERICKLLSIRVAISGRGDYFGVQVDNLNVCARWCGPGFGGGAGSRTGSSRRQGHVKGDRTGLGEFSVLAIGGPKLSLGLSGLRRG
jgi:hypothetical protein